MNMKKPAIEGGMPLCSDVEWPSWPVHGEEELKVAAEVVGSGAWWHGERVARFEREFADFQNARYAVSCTSGTSALRMALVACGVGPGDEVIVPPYTFVATALAPMLLGAVPVFADIDLASANLSVAAVAGAITEKTKAIVPVHFGGLPCDMDALLALGTERGIPVIEDACHSWGSRWRGKGTGALGACGVFSFQMSKNITSGEGGILLTDDEEIASTARSYANCGRREGAPWYEHYIVSDNLRMTEIQAALLSVQLGRLEEQVALRERNAAILDRGLSAIPGIEPQTRLPEVDRRSYHIYLFRFLDSFWSIDRDRFVEALQAEGVPCTTGYPIPLTRQPLFAERGWSESDFPESERICREAVWLPHRLLLAGSRAIEGVAAAVEKLAGAYAKS